MKQTVIALSIAEAYRGLTIPGRPPQAVMRAAEMYNRILVTRLAIHITQARNKQSTVDHDVALKNLGNARMGFLVKHGLL